MTTVVLFHSVLGLRQGEIDAAERLRADGHEVRVPDLFEGRVFDTYEPAMAFSDALGVERPCELGLAAVANLSDGFVVGGFSQGIHRRRVRRHAARCRRCPATVGL